MHTPVIAVVAFDRISAFLLSIPCTVFGEVHSGKPPFELRVCAVDAGPLRTSTGYALLVPFDLQGLTDADMVIVPSWRDPQERPPEPLLSALQAAHVRGAQVVGLCLGAFVLAEAGLLDGRRATTHWAHAGAFARRFPKVDLDAAVLYVDDGDVITSAGAAAGLDCCLYLLRRDHGAEVANLVARQLVVPPHRQGGQAQYIARPLPETSRDTRLSALLGWIRANLGQAHTLDALSARAAMSRRSFSRHFRQVTGDSVIDWLMRERLALAQQWLESSELTIEVIATRAGFGSALSLRQHFRRKFGVAPLVWRQTFRGGEGMPASGQASRIT